MRTSARRAAPRRIALGVLACTVLYGALLRFDALTLTYGPVKTPSWLRAVQKTRGPVSVLRPDSFRWEPHVGRYISDPHTYLRYGREMRSFYAAHRREPVFPLATKIWLTLLADQDVAVSFASASFSIVAILATYLLGAYAFSRWVGLGAAAALAIEYDAVTWGVGGWRDDAFTCAVVFSAYAVLRVVRAPTPRNALLLGAVAGFACLVRVTALSFLVPGFAVVALVAAANARQRLRVTAIAALTAAVLAGPYFVNCWRVFGDPLYAINVHADVYREAEREQVTTSQTASEYLRENARSRPLQTLETALLGMTLYPFGNKWHGFSRWAPWLATALAWTCAAGLFLFIGSARGRILLMILAFSLVPYAFTWRLIGDWRFTEHAYPFFLVASAYAVSQGARFVTAVALRRISRPRFDFARVLLWTSAAACVGALWWTLARVLPVRVVRETLGLGDSVSVGGGERDGVFFLEGWSHPITEGNVKARITDARYARVLLPLPGARDYGVTLRVDPFPPPADGADPETDVRVFVNEHLMGVVQLQWNPTRVGAYNLVVPAAAVQARNRLTLAPTSRSSGEAARVRFWYVRVHPPPQP